MTFRERIAAECPGCVLCKVGNSWVVFRGERALLLYSAAELELAKLSDRLDSWIAEQIVIINRGGKLDQ